MPYVTKTKEVTKYRTKYRTKYKTVERDIGYDLIPYCRARFIFFKFVNLRPNTPHWFFFNDKDVTKFVNTSYSVGDRNTVGRKHPWRRWSDQYFKSDQFPSAYGGPTNSSGPVNSNSTGELEGIFFLQFNENFQFPAGRRMLTVADVSKPLKSNALSFASTKYTSVGQIELTADFRQSYKEAYKQKYTVTEEYEVWEPDPPAVSSSSDDDDGGTQWGSYYNPNDGYNYSAPASHAAAHGWSSGHNSSAVNGTNPGSSSWNDPG